LGIEDGENDSSGEAATPKNEPPEEHQLRYASCEGFQQKVALYF